MPGLLRPTREGALRWGTVHDLRGRRWPPWSERVQCHILAFCVNQLDVDTDTWDVFCETFVILGVDLKVVEVIFVETTGVIILDVAKGVEVVDVP